MEEPIITKVHMKLRSMLKEQSDAEFHKYYDLDGVYRVDAFDPAIGQRVAIDRRVRVPALTRTYFSTRDRGAITTTELLVHYAKFIKYNKGASAWKLTLLGYRQGRRGVNQPIDGHTQLGTLDDWAQEYRDEIAAHPPTARKLRVTATPEFLVSNKLDALAARHGVDVIKREVRRWARDA